MITKGFLIGPKPSIFLQIQITTSIQNTDTFYHHFTNNFSPLTYTLI